MNVGIIEQEEQKSEKSPTITPTTPTTTTTAAAGGGAAYAITTRFTRKMDINEPERERLQQQPEKSSIKFAANKSITLCKLEQSNKIVFYAL